MPRMIILDSEPLGLLTRRKDSNRAERCHLWAALRAEEGAELVVPEIIDYELRRELIRADKRESVDRLDAFISSRMVKYLPIDSEAMRYAADLWAQARRTGKPTAPDNALDVDVILAAQALNYGGPALHFVVATGNVGHLSRFCPADNWENI
jgi:predicted nucleic acid-binding protein